MLRILSVHWGMSIGGIGKYAVQIEQAERCGDVEVHSLCILNRARQIDESTIAALRHKTIVWRDSISDLSWVDSGVALLKSYQPDLIMSHGFNGHFVASWLRRKTGNTIPAIASYHGEYHANTPLQIIAGIFYNQYVQYYLRNKVLSIVPVANYCGDFLLKHGLSQDKLNVIHNGIDNLEITNEGRIELRAEWGVSDENILIGVASRLDPVKGITYLLRGFADIAGRHPRAKLVIIGTGTLDGQLKSETAQRGLTDRVVFTGFRTDMEQCFAAFDIFALPSLAEYHSIGLLEGMRAGKTIVATDVGGNTESVRDGKEALVVPSADADALAVALDRVLGDAALRVALASAARTRFEQEFTVDRMLQKTAEWFVHCGELARESR